jgi:hypothetical protein
VGCSGSRLGSLLKKGEEIWSKIGEHVWMCSTIPESGSFSVMAVDQRVEEFILSLFEESQYGSETKELTRSGLQWNGICASYFLEDRCETTQVRVGDSTGDGKLKNVM